MHLYCVKSWRKVISNNILENLMLPVKMFIHSSEIIHASGNITGTIKPTAISLSQDKKYHSIRDKKHHMNINAENSVF